MTKSKNDELDMVTIVVQNRDRDKTLYALKKVEVPGVTYFSGHGTGVRQRLGVLGGGIEADKLILFTVVPPALTEKIIRALSEAIHIDQPGNGFLCVQKVGRVVGYY